MMNDRGNVSRNPLSALACILQVRRGPWTRFVPSEPPISALSERNPAAAVITAALGTQIEDCRSTGCQNEE